PVGALAEATPAHILVDALFGTGLTRPLDAAVQADLARLAAGAAHRIAVDLPSGVATDDGAMLGRVPAFHQTITLGALKPAHLLQPSAAHCGLVLVGAIGVEAASPIRLIGKPRLARPLPGDHKYTRGLVAIVGGAMPGAGRLAAAAAAHAGAGYVMLAGEGGGRLPDAVVVRGGDALPAMLGDARLGALLIGPGLGRDARDALDGALAIEAPLVLDGDALRLVTPEVLAKRRASTILTPHEGEFQALFGALPGSKIDRALAAARNSGAVVIYKGVDTVIATPGGEAAVSGGASPWLSTAGTGDVLAGIVTAMAVRGLDPFAAARAGVWLHGEAARRAGPAFVADDLAQHLPGAIGSTL
ncbi:MAG: NAD(P)H-hydrate dehydratase, partial [Sphingomonas sanxanigenens]